MAERNAKGNGSVRQRPDGSWEARCSINGKRRSFYGEKQADALKAMRDAQKAVDDKTYCDPTKMTFGEWLDIWMEEYLRPTSKATTFENQVRWINRNIKPALGDVKLQALNTTHIQRACNDWLKDIKASTVKTIFSIIRSALNRAVKCKHIATNPALGCVLPKGEPKKIAPFTKEEMSVFLQKLEDERVVLKNLFKIALFTGMRQGELLGLPWEAVDFENGTIEIKQQIQGHSRSTKDYYIQTPKSGKPRTIHPAPIVMEALKEVRKEQIMNKMCAGNVWKNKWDLVFTDPLGDVLRIESVRRWFKNIVSSMGRSDMRFHDLRHTYAVMALQSGIDPKTVQHTLGHHKASFTLEVYAHVTEDMNKNSANRIQEYYKQLNA